MRSSDKQDWNMREAERRIADARRTWATELDLSDFRLAFVFESIGELRGLKILDLSNNHLKQLPRSIGHLSQLRELSVENNELTHLPESIGHLEQLEELYLHDNYLTQLPKSIGQLAQLRELCLHNNHLTQLPESIGNLAQLEELYLDNNRLTQLPESLHKLWNLKALYLHDNLALNIPAEELGPIWQQIPGNTERAKPPRKILDYYFRTRDLAKRPLNEAKLILVGRGGAGKTSLRKRLITGEFDEGEDKTPGIAVVPWTLTLGCEKVKLNVWDFGGQEIMHATHQFFLTKRSLYVLVINAREGDQDANVDHWLKLIDAYGSGSPVLVVVNKCDQHPLDLDERGLREKFPCIREFVRTDCKTERGLRDLCAAIERETGALPDLHTPFPKTWFALKQKLEAMPDDCIAYDEYQKLCAANGEKDTGNQEVLIGFLNDLGSVLHFCDEARLNDLGVLKPDWVTQGIYGLLNADALKAANGVLAMPQLGTLLDKGRYPQHRHDYLLALMEKFELCFEMPNTGHARFLIPELLPKETPELPEWKDVDSLCFEYHYNILPEGLLPRFIVRTHTLSEDSTRWRHGVELWQSEAMALVRADVQERRVFIAVRGPGRQPRDLLAVIRQHFEEIHGGIKGLAAVEKVPVPGYPDVKPLDYRELLMLEAAHEETVTIISKGGVLKPKLGELLNHFESFLSRAERVEQHYHFYKDSNPTIMRDQNIKAGRDITGIVGVTLTNVTQAIQQLPPERAELRTGLEELKKHAEPLLKELPKETQEEAAQNLEDFVKEAAKEKPRKPFLEVTSKGLMEAATTVAAMSGPIIATVEKLRPLLGF